MNKDMDIIHRLLDGEISDEEKKNILNRIDSDPVLKDEFNRIEKTIRIVSSNRLIAPASFTSDVMRRLPARKESYVKEVRDFFFKGRVLRWNMATALAVACLMIIVFAGIFQFQKKNNLVQYANTTSGESTITVRINFYAPKAKKVAIAGDFNKWKVNGNILKKQDNGIWTIEIPLKPGTYNYMFVVDGKVWMTDPNAELYQDDGFGFKNSVLKVTKL